MNWRRGFVLAAINLAVAVPLIVSVELTNAADVRDRYVPVASTRETPAAVPSPAPGPESDGVSFSSPRHVLTRYSLQARGLFCSFTNFPTAYLTDSRDCLVRSIGPLAAKLHAGWATQHLHPLAAQRKVDLGLIPADSAPMDHGWRLPVETGPRRPWREPGNVHHNLRSDLSSLWCSSIQWKDWRDSPCCLPTVPGSGGSACLSGRLSVPCGSGLLDVMLLAPLTHPYPANKPQEL